MKSKHGDAGRSARTRLRLARRFGGFHALAACALILIAAPAARAGIRPFLDAGGQSTRASRESLTELLDQVVIRDRVRSWRAGGGLRIFPGSGRSDASSPASWEFRFRYGRGAGDLPDDVIHLVHEARRNPYSYTQSESYDESYTMVGVTFLSRLLPQVAVHIGPVLQRVTYKGKLSVTGTLPDPNYRQVPVSGKDKKIVNLGMVELGLQLTPKRGLPALDIFWVPKRFELSTTRKGSVGAWTGTFPDMEASIGAGLVYDFAW